MSKIEYAFPVYMNFTTKLSQGSISEVFYHGRHDVSSAGGLALAWGLHSIGEAHLKTFKGH